VAARSSCARHLCPHLPASVRGIPAPPPCEAARYLPPRAWFLRGKSCWGSGFCRQPDVTLAALEVKVSFQLSASETEHREQLSSLPAAAIDYFLAPRASLDDATQIWAGGDGGGASAANAPASCSGGQASGPDSHPACVVSPGAGTDAGSHTQLDASRNATD
uniref:Uncharacterized protein n=1 Tax=Strix occidentalis caurina TaxID=311401 RepID=A0A8D0FIR3_STROC